MSRKSCCAADDGASCQAVSRREVVKRGVAATTAFLGASLTAAADDLADFKKVFAATTRGAAPNMGRVKLTVPELAENGNAVAVTVEVQSPMSDADYVKTISVLSERNPQILLFRAHFNPRSGRAKLATNVRLADTQKVIAIAEMNNGTFWMAETSVIVTLAACLDTG